VAQSPQGVVRSYQTDGGQSATYSELWRRAGRLAAGLQHLGIGEGACVVLLIDDVVDFVAAFWACIRAGCTAVPLMSAARAAFHSRQSGPFHEVLGRLNRAVVLVDDKFAPIAAALLDNKRTRTLSLAAAEMETDGNPREQPSADPVCLVPTSGSTGGLKLVALGEQAILNRIFPYLRKDDNWLGTLALDSVTAQNGVFLRFASWTQIPPDLLTGRPTSLLDAIERHRITMVGLTNSAVRAMIEAAAQSGRRWDLGSLKNFGMGAESIVPKVVENLVQFLQAQGAPPDSVRCGYGTTETGFLVAGAGPTESLRQGREAVSLGPCALGVNLRVVGPEGEILAEEEVGEVQAYCPQTIFSGYWGEPEVTKQSFTADGWWRTGDLGLLRNGELSLHGRVKELLIISGRKFSLASIDAEIDTVLALGDRAYSCAVHWPGEASERLAVVMVPADDDPAYRVELADKISRAVIRRFGFRPNPILTVSLDDIPLASNGKLRRQELSARVRAGILSTPANPDSVATQPADPSSELAAIETRLAQIWRDTLNVEGELDRDGNFFDLGGDSLRSLILHEAIEEQFGKAIAPEDFFAEPTFGNLLRLVAEARQPAPGSPIVDATIPWPLPPDLRSRLLRTFAAWEGNRPTRDKMVAGLNVNGSKTPLFWVCQGNVTFRQLADHLGPDQPVYAFRSGEGLIKYTEDEVQAFALRYIAEITEVHPDGPVFIGGCCQGAIIAFALAQHLVRRGRHIPLLILADWGFPLHAYTGPVLFMYGRDSMQDNPYLQYRDPDPARAQWISDYTVVEVPGAHGAYYDIAFPQVLPVHMQKAEGRLPARLPRSAHRALLRVADIPENLLVGAQCTISVELENLSAVTWPASEQSNLYLANRWLDEAGNVLTWLDGRMRLPELPPRGRLCVPLTVTAPSIPGKMQLVVDVVEEGNTWLFLPQRTPLPARVKVVRNGPPPVDEILAELSATKMELDRWKKYTTDLKGHYETSTSWRLTRPLRSAKGLLRRIRTFAKLGT
jgi:acyl-CoA synthetase (AMP-forming)/AMP-acid ligase II/acyl carrier protein